MSKKTQSKAKNSQPDYVSRLIEKGTAVLVADSVDKLNDMLKNIPCRYAAGAVGKDTMSGLYSLRLYIIND